MNSAAEPPSPARARLAAAAIAAAGLLVYAGSLSGPMVFDDLVSIGANPTIRHWSTALSPPPGGLTVSGRPLLNLSFALNYAISGTRVWSYHALNLLIHLLAALTLFGVIRRTLAALRRRDGGKWPRATAFAFAVALLWVVHPLQTESVTYIVQRAESLVGLFYLLTMYCFIRYAEREAGGPAWGWLAVLCCLLGMATKEVMATAPVMVWLYDRTFFGGTLPGAWKRRRPFYAGLAGTWGLTAFLVAGTPGRGGTAGFGTGVPWWAYGYTQFRAIAHYLRLAVWPRPLIFDYGPMLGGDPRTVMLDAAVVVGLAAVSLLLCLRRRPLGFAGVWCFLILLPSSSVVPVPTETMAEHRMYLSLAGVLTVVVGLAWASARRWGPAVGLTARGAAVLGPTAALAASAVLGFGTVRRNELYRSPLALWSDAVARLPENARAHNNLGYVLMQEGDPGEAEAQFRTALALAPNFAEAHNNLGNLLVKQGRLAEAEAHFREALRYRSWDPEIYQDLGDALLRLGRIEEARGLFAEAVHLDPQSPAGHFDLGSALDQEGEGLPAAAQYREALRLDPDYAKAWYNLGSLLVRTGRFAEAADAFAAAVRLQPDFTDARVNYGDVLTQLGRTGEAIGEFQAALRLQPGAADVRDDLGSLLAQAGRWTEARAQFAEALRLDPGDRIARAGLERSDAILGASTGP